MRTAACHCGSLTAACEGEPGFIALCHCQLCQRRTGSSYNLGAWFQAGAVTIAGAEQLYTRTGDEGGPEIRFHFCPTCGTSVYWDSPGGPLPGMLAVAVGCFADPGFPAPTLSLYGKRRHHWLAQPEGMPSFREAVGSEQE